MIKKLLLVLFIGISFNSFSQTIAYAVPDLHQCNYEVFDLTVNSATVLGNQNPAIHSVNFFLSAANANTNANPIANPTSFVGGMTNVIYIRVTNTQNSSFAVTSFTASWNFSGAIGPFSDVTVCDEYSLPPLPANLSYNTGPNGSAMVLMAGSIITSTMQIYVHDDVNNCSNGDDFMVVVINSPVPPIVQDIVACDAYALPALMAGNYSSGPGGSGTVINMGDLIMSSQTIYVYVANGMCTTESSFNVTIIPTPEGNFPNVYSCTEYVLPTPASGFQYWTMPGGMGTAIAPGTVISQSKVIYANAESGTIPNCTSEYEIEINIGEQTIILENLTGCDLGNGEANFLLPAAIPYDLQQAGIAVTFHETIVDAYNGINAISGSNYVNIVPYQQTLYVRIEFAQDCITISDLSLVVGECSNSTISGTVSLDSNGNGCDAGDPQMTNTQLSLTNGNTVMYAYANASGQYSFYGVPEGNNNITISSLPAYFTTPASQLVITTGNNDSDIANFCVAGPAPVSDAQLSLTAMAMPVPGFEISYVLRVQNIGSTVLSGSATFSYDNMILNYIGSSPIQASQTSNTVTFNYSNLNPSQHVAYYLNFVVFTPPTVVSGNVLNVSATAVTNQSDINLGNNAATLQQTVVNSYDPNDISVHEGHLISEQQADGYLHYTIRFQNSGTAPAVNVRLENVLDLHLDWSTLIPLAASHSYFAERTGNNLTFRFNNIMLPAEQDNEPASHGWITYKVKPVSGFAIGDVISNVAHIYFDFNAPIVTNTVTTQIQQLSIDSHSLGMLKLYPNPASDNVFFNGFDGPVNIIISDIRGKSIKTAVITAGQSVEVSNLEAGIYFVRIASEGIWVTKKLIVE